MDGFDWTIGDFKGSLFLMVFGFVFVALFLQLRSVNKTIAEREAQEKRENGGD